MRYRLFGSTRVKVSEVGFGAWAIGGEAGGLSYGPTDDAESERVLRAAYDMGCNLFDTADVYGLGHSEELIGRALGDRRGGILIATKGGFDLSAGGPRQDFSPEHLERAVHGSLRRLATDWIDLYQLHDPTGEVIRSDAVLGLLERLKGAGKIRWAGVSVDSPETALEAIDSGRFEAIQIRVNLADATMLPGVLPAAKRHRVAVLAREPLASGLLTGKYPPGHMFPGGDVRSRIPAGERDARARLAGRLAPLVGETTATRAQLAIKYVLAFDAVSSALAGIKTRAQLEDDLEPGIGDPITVEEFEAIRAALGEGGTPPLELPSSP